MNDHDPLKHAFGERRAAAEAVDVEAGLAGVHRRNSLVARGARATGALTVVVVAIVGLTWWLQDDDDGANVGTEPATTPVPTDSQPPGSGLPSTSIPVPSSGLPSIILTDGRDRVLVDGQELPVGVEPVTDAVDDLGGGLVFETDDALWHWPASAPEPVRVVDELPGGDLDLIDVTVDASNAATTVVYTDVAAPESPVQALYKRQLYAAEPVQPELVIQVGGEGFAITTGGANGTSPDGATLVALAGTDGSCARIVRVDLAGGSHPPLAETCTADGGGQAADEDLVRAVDLTHEGEAMWLANTTLERESSFTLDLEDGLELGGPLGVTATLDIVEPLALALTATGDTAQAVRIDLTEGTVAPVADVPRGMTSARLTRTAIERQPDTPVGPASPQLLAVTPGEYRVVDVAPDDQLNVRMGPGPEYAVEGGVPNGGIVTGTGSAVRLDNDSVWYELAWPEDMIVWANARFLELIRPASAADPFPALPCLVAGQEPPTATLPQVSTRPPARSDADHVAGVQFVPADGCFRTIIHFGSAFAVDPAGGPAAAQLPAGIVVRSSDDALSVMVELPDVIDEVALGSAVDAGPAVVVRDADGHPYIEILSGPHDAAAGFLADPARVVVDYVPRPPVPDDLPFPLYEEAGIIIRSIDGLTSKGGDLSSAQWTPPITVTGFARPFEANIGLTMRDNQGDLFEEVAWNGGPSGAQVGSRYFTMTTDWSSAWGRFSFTIESMPAGSFTLELSGDGGSDDPRVLTIPITITP